VGHLEEDSREEGVEEERHDQRGDYPGLDIMYTIHRCFLYSLYMYFLFYIFIIYIYTWKKIQAKNALSSRGTTSEAMSPGSTSCILYILYMYIIIYI